MVTKDFKISPFSYGHTNLFSCNSRSFHSYLSYNSIFNYTANISAVKNTLFTCVLKAHVLPLYFLHQNKCKFYIRLIAILYTGINAIFPWNKCNFYKWINVFTYMYIYSIIKITFIHVQKLHLFQCKNYKYVLQFNYTCV